jgi:hypothetical protein
MTASEDVFRFVAIRDPQRRVRAGVLLAPAYDPAAPSRLLVTLEGALTRQGRSSQADSYVADPSRFAADPPDRLDRPRFIRLLAQAPAPLRLLDAMLTARSDRVGGSEIVDFVRARWPTLIAAATHASGNGDDDGPGGDGEPPTLRELLDDPVVHGMWRDCADSMLATIYGTAPHPLARAELARAMLLWELLDRLAGDDRIEAGRVVELLATGLILTPAGDETSPIRKPARPAPAATGDLPPSSRTTGGGSPAILERLGRLSAAVAGLRVELSPLVAHAALDPIPADQPAITVAHDPTTTAPLHEMIDRLDQATREVLVDEGLHDPGASLSVLIAGLERRANATVVAAMPATSVAMRRSAIAEEYVRRRGWSLGGLEPTVVDTTTPVSTARLLSPPVIGDLKVVRQTLRGYSFGEIAHVENVLSGERKERRHEIIDVREQEITETSEREEERAFDTQTTERNELAREVQTTLSTDERFNVGATLEASYPPYVKLTATAGYAKATARTESTATSTRFARDITERATTRVRQRTEEVRRTLTRRTVSELNTHELNNLDGTGPVVGVYRWLNKEYCAQVLNYGQRVLLEIGVSDPSANYRYAVARGSDLDVDVDPPPPLVFPGTSTPLQPVHIGTAYWESLAAHFRVADFPPPPAYLITTTMALSAKAAPAGAEAAPSSGGGSPLVGEAPVAGEGGPPPPPPPAFEVNRELTIPNGYLPNSFTAVVLSADGEQPAPTLLSDETRDNVLATLTRELSPDPLWVTDYLPLITQWFAWRPDLEPNPTLSERQLVTGQVVLQSLRTLPRRISRSFDGFLNAARGWLPRAGVDLAIGPVLVSIPFGARRAFGSFAEPSAGGTFRRVTPAEPDDYTLPLAATARSAGFAITVTVVCEASPELERRWQAEAYQAILAAHASWDADFRAAVAAAETRRGVTIEGRNPLENELLVRAELKRSAIAMLGGVSAAELQAVTPGNPLGTGTAPALDVEAAARAGQLVRFYEQAFEWEHMAFILYPYFWTGRDDWPEAALRTDPDPQMVQFLRSGYARLVLPVRPGFETVVESRLNLDLPEPFTATPPATSADDPSLPIADEIRAAQDLAGGVPDGDPWPITLPTTLVALDGTPLPWQPTPCDPTGDDDDTP